MSFKETVKKAGEGIKKSVTGVADTVKTEYKRAQLKKELSELHETLGQVRYTELISGGEITEESVKLCEEIARVKNALDTLEEDISKGNVCAFCGKNLPDNITYCPYCGTKTEGKE